MAGTGPPPKPAGTRARRNTDPVPTTSMRLVRKSAPELPDSVDWHAQTRVWWAEWAESELSRDFTSSDWSFLLDTALMHHAMWSKGQWTLAAEVRLRVAKFGATPEDRARLRIIFEDANAAEDRGAKRRNGASPAVTAPTRSRKADPRSILRAV